MELGEIANLKDKLVKDQKDNLPKADSTANAKEEVKRVAKKDQFGRSYGTGRRKGAVARVWIMPGKGIVTANKKKFEEYFPRGTHRIDILRPFSLNKLDGQFDVMCTVKGGGLSGQAGAIRLAIARALDNYNPDAYHKTLRKEGMLTRDSRVVERKKYGQHKARKKTQFSKR